mmetsp:Transcript_57500/g.136787  ORF Transcript_57500/g.136787 Transcript_57500/m.136787 type:complete len:98 (+) Transcript_57500:300-593(+)
MMIAELSGPPPPPQNLKLLQALAGERQLQSDVLGWVFAARSLLIALWEQAPSLQLVLILLWARAAKWLRALLLAHAAAPLQDLPPGALQAYICHHGC